MVRKLSLCAIGLMVTLVLAACSTTSGPSSSTAAGVLQSPTNQTTYKYQDQPITLTTTNGVSTGTSPATYVFEVASDSAFASKAYTSAKIPAGANGQTICRLDKTLDGGSGGVAKTYYWHVQVFDGDEGGAYSAVQTFGVMPPATIGVPTLVSPANGETVGSTQPTFTIANASRTGDVGTVYYRFEVADNSGFAPVAAAGTVQEQPSGQTSWTPSSELPTGKTLYWHVRSADPANNLQSSFSNTWTFSLTQGIDLRTVVYVKGPDISRWPQTSTLTQVVQGGGQLCTYHTMLGLWPGTQYFDTDATVEGNQWVIAYIKGRWYAGAADWYRPGQACKAQDANSIGGDNFYNSSEEPLHSWVPRVGEPVGYAVSTPARLWPQMSTRDERSNVVIEPWK